jgi:hypothetical protein
MQDLQHAAHQRLTNSHNNNYKGKIMKASTVLITISALAAAIAGAVLLRRHLHEKQQAEAHLMQVDATHPAAQAAAHDAHVAAVQALPRPVAVAARIASKPVHPAHVAKRTNIVATKAGLHTLGWDTQRA